MLALAGAGFWTLLWALAPAATPFVDEVVYFAGIAALADHGQLTLENGPGLPPSRDLRLVIMREAVDGLAPQYPPGLTVIAAPLFSAFGIKGISLVNLVGGLASLALTWSIARQFAPARVAAVTVALLFGASFLINYSVAAIWPHGLALALSLAGVRAAMAAAAPGRKLRSGWALAGGLAIGIGITVRLDVALILPGLAVWFLLTAPRPYAHGTLAAVGLIPPLAGMAWANHLKFGTWNPFSYGNDSGGGTDPSGHLPVLALFAAVGASALAWRHLPRARPALAFAPLVAGAFALIALPEARSGAMRMLHGLWLLLVDLSTHPEVGVRPGVARDAETGIVTFWDFHKKTILQSLPWLGVLPLLCRRDTREKIGGAKLLIIALSLSVILPFVPGGWHGGFGGDMR